MWSGPEHSSLNAVVKSSRQALDRMAELFQSPPVNRWLEALVKKELLQSKVLCYVIV